MSRSDSSRSFNSFHNTQQQQYQHQPQRSYHSHSPQLIGIPAFSGPPSRSSFQGGGLFGMQRRAAFPAASTPSVAGDPEGKFEDSSYMTQGNGGYDEDAEAEEEYANANGDTPLLPYKSPNPGSQYSTPVLGANGGTFSSPPFLNHHANRSTNNDDFIYTSPSSRPGASSKMSKSRSTSSFVNMGLASPTRSPSGSVYDAPPTPTWKTFLGSRRGIHPALLLPAFILGALLVISDPFGQRQAADLMSQEPGLGHAK